jgi:dienelactone hydrolase
MLSGRRAFGGPTSADTVSAILKEDPPPLAGLREAVSPMLEHIVERCLEKRPDDRFSSAHDLGLALSALSSGTVDRASASGASNDGRAVAATEAARFVSPVARLSARFGARRRRWGLAELAVVAVLAILAVAYPVVVHERRVAWVHNEALPALEVLADPVQFLEEGRESWDAFLLAGKVEQVAPHDPVVERLAPRFTRNITIVSDPPGAEVRAWYYDEPDAAPVVVGKTPLVNIRYPRGFTRLRILLAGRPTIDDVICNTALMGNTFTYRLHAVGELPSGMAWVPGGTSEIYLPGLDSLKAEPVASFLMDRHEVTNREFKQFVDAGGYANPTFWREPFIDRGRELPGNEALARFVDRTGRPGPATWEVGTFPEGGGELPVGGVSWYEAAAYARWAGKSLPTVFHWNRVALTPGSARIAPLANLGRKGPVPVGTTKSENRFGVADLAGNVREWVLNSSGRDGGRYVLGGGWNDPDYAFADAYAQPPFDRSATNGFRCIRYVEKDGNLAELQRALERPTRDFRAEKPVSDAVFEQYLRQFRYDRTPLNAVIEQEKKIPSGTRQKVTFDAAYGSERMTAYLFLPPMGSPPYQVVIVFPGSGAIGAGSSDAVELGRVDFVLKSGRAVMYPIYKGTFERTGTLRSDSPQQTVAYEEFVIMWEKDLARSIDYLETRRDIDTKRIAYYGLSWGAALGAILPAVETRIRANVLYVAGLDFDRALPEVDAINYVGRVKQPTLILNGELDFFFPVETSQRPLFDLLGTPAGDKKRLVYPGGHSVPRTEQIRESLQWFDRYLGPVASTPGR